MTTASVRDIVRLAGLGEALPDENIVPQALPCPECRKGALQVFRDPGGEWHWCDHCGRHGDTTALAAYVLNCPVEEVRLRLEDRNMAVPPAITADDHLPEDWSIAYKDGYSEASRLKHLFRLDDRFSDSRWLRGAGRWAGAASCRSIENAWWEGRRRKHRIFPGPDWQGALIVAFESLPGRVCGWWVVGRQGGEEDRVFLPRHTVKLPGKPREAGILGLSWLRRGSAARSREVLALEDPTAVLRLQARRHVGSDLVLPVVGWQDGPGAVTSAEAWSGLRGATPVFWCHHLTPAVLNQAVQAEGWLRVADRDEHEPVELLDWREGSPRLLEGAFRQARPWREELRTWSAARETAELEGLILGLRNRYGFAPNWFGPFPRLLDTIRGMGEPASREARIGRQLVFETADGWFRAPAPGARRRGPDERICNVLIRCDSLRPAANQQFEIEGRVIRANSDTLRYRIRSPSPRRHFRRFLEAVEAAMMAQGTGAILFDARFDRLGWDIVAGFEEPKLVDNNEKEEDYAGTKRDDKEQN